MAVVWGRLYAIPVAVASMLAFNFFFLPPRYTFHLADEANWLALAVYLVTAVVVSDLLRGLGSGLARPSSVSARRRSWRSSRSPCCRGRAR